MMLRTLPALGAPLLLLGAAIAQTPVDTYFSLAVTENSHNHVGASNLFLDFQQAPFGSPNGAAGQVISAEVAPGAITLDGDASEWNPALLSTIPGVVQNNYPLSEFLDGVPVDLTVGSAWDATHVYFLVRWEDAGHNRSVRFEKWIFGNQGNGESGWNPQIHVGATPGAPNASAVNASGHVLSGAESEDRVFFMFPIVDTEGNYVPGGPGCAMYCHANLDEDFPWQNYTGEGVSRMGTNVPGDKADIWHWKAARTEPSGFADDKWLDYATGTTSGRKSDAGTSAYFSNVLSGGNPSWMHMSGLGWLGEVLFDYEAVPFSGTPSLFDELPAVVSRAPAGSRGDVESAATFDPLTGMWTLELRRLRDTGNPDDHSFDAGSPAAPPAGAIPVPGDAASGQALFDTHCASCHLSGGLGQPASTNWAFPRVQRASGSLIWNAIENVPIMGFLQGTFTQQEREDIAAYLQTQAVFQPERTLTVQVVGASGASLVVSDPPGIDAPGSETVTWIEGTPVVLTASAPPGYALAGWSGPCSGSGSTCSFTLSGDTTVIATFAEVGPGSVFCTGDGAGTPCPCGNDNDGSLRGGLAGCANGSSSGGASLWASGSASVAAGDLVLRGEGLPAGQPGLYFQGLNTVAGGAGLAFGDGLRCAGTSVVRIQVRFADSTGTSATTLDIAAKGGVAPGDLRRYQLWYRDPAGSPCGATFNLTNGYEVTWAP